jgi:hypothetical protein
LKISKASAGLVALVVLCAAGCSSSSTSGSGSCPGAVDTLSASLLSVTNAADINSATAHASLAACGGPAEWKLSAGVDQIGTKIGSLGDMGNPTMSTGDALDFLCSRFDSGNSTDTCKLR